MEVRCTAPVKLVVPDEFHDDRHETAEQFPYRAAYGSTTLGFVTALPVALVPGTVLLGMLLLGEPLMPNRALPESESVQGPEPRCAGLPAASSAAPRGEQRQVSL